MSNIQVYRKLNRVTTVTVALLSIILTATLLELRIVPLILTLPVFLFPVSVYTSIIGLYDKKQPHLTHDYTYYFTWGAIMLVTGIEWILLYERMDITIEVIAGLSIALGYVYLNKFKSRTIS